MSSSCRWIFKHVFSRSGRWKTNLFTTCFPIGWPVGDVYPGSSADFSTFFLTTFGIWEFVEKKSSHGLSLLCRKQAMLFSFRHFLGNLMRKEGEEKEREKDGSERKWWRCSKNKMRNNSPRARGVLNVQCNMVTSMRHSTSHTLRLTFAFHALAHPCFQERTQRGFEGVHQLGSGGRCEPPSWVRGGAPQDFNTFLEAKNTCFLE